MKQRQRLLRHLWFTLPLITLSGCASDIYLRPHADTTARTYAECRERADVLYAKVSRYPTPHAFPFFPFGVMGRYLGSQMTDGDLDITAVAQLPCFRQNPPYGVEIGPRIQKQIERERRYLYPHEYAAFQQVCGGSGSLVDCPVYRMLMEGCRGDLGHCGRMAGDQGRFSGSRSRSAGRKAFNEWLQGVIRSQAERRGYMPSSTGAPSPLSVPPNQPDAREPQPIR